MEQYGCVLLKGGKSNRMGGSDKAKLLYRGKSFEERIKGELEQLAGELAKEKGREDEYVILQEIELFLGQQDSVFYALVTHLEKLIISETDYSAKKE